MFPKPRSRPDHLSIKVSPAKDAGGRGLFVAHTCWPSFVGKPLLPVGLIRWSGSNHDAFCSDIWAVLRQLIDRLIIQFRIFTIYIPSIIHLNSVFCYAGSPWLILFFIHV
jgi:hypothetical protein